MVFLLAALYSVYRSSSTSNTTINNNPAAEDPSERNDSENDPQQQQQQQRHQRFAQSLQRGGSQLYQHAVLRCSTVPTETTETGTSEQTTTDPTTTVMELDVLNAPPEVARTSGSASSSSGGSNSSSADGEPNNLSKQQQHSNFNAAVKQEWIDAVFGRDFMVGSSNSAAAAGSSETSVCGGKFQCISCTIPPAEPSEPSASSSSSQLACNNHTSSNSNNNNNNNCRVGVTVSRLAIGVYAQTVAGEAAWAGVEPGSILVAINDLPVLAEPTQALLERLWQYEGFLLAAQSKNSTSQEDYSTLLLDESILSNTAAGTAATAADRPPSAAICDPVALKFVRDHRVYTVLLLSATQQQGWGIQWAPAAPLPLIKRVAGRAAAAKVPAGTLVAAVAVDSNTNDGIGNDHNFRNLDHVSTAVRLKEQHEQGRAVTLQLVVPPPEARASHAEPPQPVKHAARSSSNGSKTKAALISKKKQPTHIEGVEIKFLPLGYAIGSLCHSDKNVYHESANKNASMSLEDLAEAVASGRREAPVLGRTPAILLQQQQVPKYQPCPELRSLLDVWDPLQSLVYCLRFHACAYDEATLTEQLHGRQTLQKKDTLVQQLYELTCSPAGVSMTNAFLLQFISLICVPRQPNDDNNTRSSGANELTSMLLKLSRRNEAFCQRLYFLLRSYISTFETSGPSMASGTEGDPRNLMALLNCLELLRFAEKELSGRIFSKSNGGQNNMPQQQRHEPDWTPFPERTSRQTRIAQTLGRVGSSSLETSIRGVVASVDQPTQTLDPMQQQAAPPSPIAVTPESPPTSADTAGSPKKKKLFGSWASKKASSPPKSKSPQRRRRPPQHINTSSAATTISALTEQQRSDAASLSQTPSTMYENMADFLTELDKICGTIERSLQKSFRQKIADWALQPWSAGKDAALAEVTADMRSSLEECSTGGSRKMLLVNPVESSELLSSVDYNECYILPSANFPILLTFNVSERRCSDDSIEGEERLYRTRIELFSLQQQQGDSGNDDNNEYYNSFAVQCAVAGTISESGESTRAGRSSPLHTWQDGGVLQFETRSALGAPQTVSLRLSGNSENFDKRGQFHSEVGFCWLDLSDQWKTCETFGRSVKRITTEIWPNSLAACRFDEHGDLPEDALNQIGKIQLELRVTTEAIDADDDSPRKRMLLYKHNDDLRQEALAIQFIKICDDLLKASGLDMKLLTFQCTPVGTRRGFVEWVPGSVTLSEICHPFATSSTKKTDDDDKNSPSVIKKASLSKYESLRRLGGQKSESLRRIAGGTVAGAEGSIANDPVQDYLRSVAFDPEAPYLIRRDVMDTYVKSCAGYSVITYILGVGDRHLDNLLLHTSGAFFHCDFSFILGSDPKKANMPMRITEAMVDGMGGRESDNYSKFLSLVGAAFLALRRPENVRVLLSMVRLMEASCLPDTSENQTIEQAIHGMRDRLRLDLSESRAVCYIEEAVEASLSNKLWIAVDAFHNLGKKF